MKTDNTERNKKIAKELKNGTTLRRLSEKYGISQTSIRAIGIREERRERMLRKYRDFKNLDERYIRTLASAKITSKAQLVAMLEGDGCNIRNFGLKMAKNIEELVGFKIESTKISTPDGGTKYIHRRAAEPVVQEERKEKHLEDLKTIFDEKESEIFEELLKLRKQQEELEKKLWKAKMKKVDCGHFTAEYKEGGYVISIRYKNEDHETEYLPIIKSNTLVGITNAIESWKNNFNMLHDIVNQWEVIGI